MAVPPMQQSKASIIVDEVKDMVPPAPVQKEKKSVSRKSAKIVVDTPETNSDSEPEFVDEYKESYETGTEIYSLETKTIKHFSRFFLQNCSFYWN